MLYVLSGSLFEPEFSGTEDTEPAPDRLTRFSKPVGTIEVILVFSYTRGTATDGPSPVPCRLNADANLVTFPGHPRAV